MLSLRYQSTPARPIVLTNFMRITLGVCHAPAGRHQGCVRSARALSNSAENTAENSTEPLRGRMVTATSTEAPLRAAHRGGLGALPAGPAQARWSRRQVETIARSFCAGAAIAARTRLALAQKKAWTQHSCHQTQSSSQTSRIACPQCLPGVLISPQPVGLCLEDAAPGGVVLDSREAPACPS